jgi:membrane-bound metal-dependent hydrolase YbcI (DUF457 family)
MLPHTHFLFALLIGILTYSTGKITIPGIVALIAVSTLIDIDHPITYFKHHKKLSLKKAWNNAVTGHEHEWTIVHKPIGILVIIMSLFIFMKFYQFAYAIFLGYFCHIFLDYIHIIKEEIRKHKFFNFLNIKIPISYSEIGFDIILIISNIAAFYFVF